MPSSSIGSMGSGYKGALGSDPRWVDGFAKASVTLSCEQESSCKYLIE